MVKENQADQKVGEDKEEDGSVRLRFARLSLKNQTTVQGLLDLCDDFSSPARDKREMPLDFLPPVHLKKIQKQINVL
jgi:hypothetical protein